MSIGLDVFAPGRGGYFYMTTVAGTDKTLLAGLKKTDEWDAAHRTSNPNESVAYLLRGIGGRIVDDYVAKNRFVDQGLAILNSRLSNIALLTGRGWVTNAVPSPPALLQLGISSAAWNRTQSGCQSAITSGGLSQAAGTLSIPSPAGDVTDDTYQVAYTFTASIDFVTSPSNNAVREACIRVSDGGAGYYALCRATFSDRQVTSGNDLIATYKLKMIP